MPTGPMAKEKEWYGIWDDMQVFECLRPANETDAIGLMLAEGLVYDGAEAVMVAKRWSANKYFEVLCEDQQLSGRNRPEQLTNSNGNLLEEIRQHIRKIWPGLFECGDEHHHQQQYDRMTLSDGDSIRLCASGHWVATQSGCCMPRFLGPSPTGLYLEMEPEKAMDFFISVDNKTQVVYYGEPLTLKTCTGQAWENVQFVSPGRKGPVRHGDHVFIVSGGKKFRSWCIGASRFHCALTPIKKTESKRGLERAPLCFTIHCPDQGSRLPDNSEMLLCDSMIRQRQQICVLVYNVWMLPKPVTSWAQPLYGTSLKKRERARLIPFALRKVLASSFAELDVAVLCEAFCYRATPILKAGLKRECGLHFETNVIGSGPFLKDFSIINGGVTIMSRFPIVRTGYRLFGKASARDDAFANKGVVYACIEKHGRLVHVFGTHLQAWNYPQAVNARQLQLLMLREYIQEMRIPKNEPVVIAGDLNVCREHDFFQYERMLDILAANDTVTRGLPCYTAEKKEDRREFNLVKHTKVTRNYFSSRKRREQQTTRTSRKNNNGLGLHERLLHEKDDDEDEEEEFKRASSTSNVSFEEECHQMDVSYNDSELQGGGEGQQLFSMNPSTNVLARTGISTEGKPGALDYVLYSRNHLQPMETRTRIIHEMRTSKPYRYRTSDFTDLSDHYPVISQIRF